MQDILAKIEREIVESPQHIGGKQAFEALVGGRLDEEWSHIVRVHEDSPARSQHIGDIHGDGCSVEQWSSMTTIQAQAPEREQTSAENTQLRAARLHSGKLKCLEHLPNYRRLA